MIEFKKLIKNFINTYVDLDIDKNQLINKIDSINNFSDLGSEERENKESLNAIELVFTKFIELEPKKMQEFINNSPELGNPGYILTNIYLFMSLYNYYYIEKSDNLDDLNESTIDKLKIIIDKLSKFIPEIFFKIT